MLYQLDTTNQPPNSSGGLEHPILQQQDSSMVAVHTPEGEQKNRHSAERVYPTETQITDLPGEENDNAETAARGIREKFHSRQQEQKHYPTSSTSKALSMKPGAIRKREMRAMKTVGKTITDVVSKKPRRTESPSRCTSPAPPNTNTSQQQQERGRVASSER